MWTTCSTASLQETVCNYTSHVGQITDLRKDTIECFKEIQNIINLERKYDVSELKALQLPDSDLNNRLPSVLFIGSQNCGKSSLLNVFLQKSNLLPVDETPCTSRIVRIVYSQDNYTKIKDPTTNQEHVKTFKTKVAKDLIVLKGEDRNDCDKLKVVVEVGLNHPLLECGIEVLDSPGRNENEALDDVVEEFVQKGIVPLIVYVVDGNYHLRQNDRTRIRELQDKFPSVSLLFVCSKVDVDINAKRYDKDNEIEDTEDGSTTPIDVSQEMFELARQKKIAVFKQLKSLDFLPSDDQMDSSELFHGVSAKLVKKARKRNLRNEATMSFERFEHCLLEKLGSSLRKVSRRELAALLSAQERFLSSVVGAQRNISSANRNFKEDYQRALKAEESIFNLISDLIIKRDSITNTIVHDFEGLSAILVKEAQDYQYDSKGEAAKAQSAALVIEFSREMKSHSLDRTFYVLRRTFQRALKKGITNAVLVTILVKTVTIQPVVSRMLRRTLGSENVKNVKHSKEDTGILGAYMALENVLESLNREVDSLLRKEIKQRLEEFDFNKCGIKPSPRDPVWRRTVVQKLLQNINCKDLSSGIITACEKALVKKRWEFKVEIEAFHILTESLVENPGLESKIADYVPRVAHLAVKGHSLRYAIERGPPELGPKIMSTAHGQIYSCTSPLWCFNLKRSVVKVVAKEAVSQKVWDQTMLDCIHFKDISDKLGIQHPNLLELTGWFFPDPDQLHIVMEKAECDLLMALKRGLSWKKRKEVAMDVAKGLEAIHGVEYVYQDLKPQNVMLTADGTAKINLCKPEKPFEVTQLGAPFHISPEMFQNYGTDRSSVTFDIYAFGSLLWVLCEGSGNARPQAYSKCQDSEAMKFAVYDREIIPERPQETPDSWWKLMEICWKERSSVTIETVLTSLQDIQDDMN